MSSLIKFENVSLNFGGVNALTEVSFEVPENSLFSIIGPNGAGKSTLMKIIYGMIQPDSGTIEVFNKEEKLALIALVKKLDECNDKMTPEDIQTKIFSVGKENGYKENLRDWFKLIYEVVFGDENGPRMGFFISFFGVKETQNLIKEKIM